MFQTKKILVKFARMLNWIFVCNSPVGCQTLWNCGIRDFIQNFNLVVFLSLLNWILSMNQHRIKENLECVFSCGVVAYVILVKWLALMKTEKLTCRGVKMLWNCCIRVFLQIFDLVVSTVCWIGYCQQTDDDSNKSSICVFSCCVVAFVILVKWPALVKTQNSPVGVSKNCGIEAFVILVKLLAFVKIEKFTCRGVKTLWNCGVRDPREMTSSRENRKIHL